MHRINTLGVAVLMSLAGLVMVAGCSEGEVRGANQSLQEQVSNALRLRDQALNLMEAPPVVETATGKMLPLQGVEVDPEKYENQLHSAPDGQTPDAPVQLVLDEKLNPNVLNLLDRARELIEKELEGTKADEANQALARSVLGRIYELKGDYLGQRTNQHRNAAYARVSQARDILGTVTQQKGILAYYDKLLSLEDQDVQAMKSDAQSDAKELSAEIKTLSSQIKERETQQQKLLEKKNTLEANARALRSEARAPGKKGYEADIKALEIMDQVGQVDTQVSKLDNEVSVLRMKLSERTMKESIAKALIAAADKIVTGREEGTDANGMGGRQAVRRQRAQLNQEHQKSLAAGSEVMGDLAEALKNWSAAEKEAGNAYFAAGKNYGRYDKLASMSDMRTERVDALAQQATVQMAFGRSNVERLYLHSEVEELLEQVGEYWPGGAPGEAGRVRELLKPTTEQIRKTGTQQYQDAIDSLEDAISRADRAYKWLYRGAQARAYIGKAEIAGSTAPLDEADSVLKEALAGRSESPLVRANVGRIQSDIREVRAMLGG